MKKPRLPKVGVKHYLHKKVKPIIEGEKNLYPVYIRITFQNKSTNFKSRWRVFLDDSSNVMIEDESFDLWSDDDFLSLRKNESYKDALDSEINAIQSLVHFFYLKMEINLVTTSAALLIDKCLRPISEIISEELNNRLESDIKSYFSERISDIIFWKYSSFLDIYDGLSSFSKDKGTSTSFNKSVLSQYLMDYNDLKELSSSKIMYFEWLLISMERYKVPLKFYKILDSYLNKSLFLSKVNLVAIERASR